MSARGSAAVAALLTLGLAAGCASVPPPSATPDAPVAIAIPAGSLIPDGQQAGAMAALDAALKVRFGALPLSDAWRRLAAVDGQPPRLRIEADRAFEAGNAQLKPALLLPLAEAAAVTRSHGAWVLHAVARAPTPEDRALAERRAASVIAYLGTQGIPGGRLRAEIRAGNTRQIDLHWAPIVTGREAQAWMPPSGGAP